MRFARNENGIKNGQKPICPSTKTPQKRAKRVLVVASFLGFYRFKNTSHLLEIRFLKLTDTQNINFSMSKTGKCFFKFTGGALVKLLSAESGQKGRLESTYKYTDNGQNNQPADRHIFNCHLGCSPL